MKCYRVAGQEFYFDCPVPELASYEITGTQQGTADEAVPFVSPAFLKNELIARTEGWVSGAQRKVETWPAPPGLLLRVAGGSDFYISPGGQAIVSARKGQGSGGLNVTDRQILLGPALVLALALRGTWCLHASAALFNDNLIACLGESGQGKSTLGLYLAATDWRLVADDILPMTMGSDRVAAWPRFPQLKLPMDAQPGPGLPEQLSISNVCVLMNAEPDEMPGLQRLPAGQSVQVFLGHTAGTRLFDPEVLAKHLTFCSRAAEQVPVYRLSYPHRQDALPIVRELLESLC
jgi:hypothetical protein